MDQTTANQERELRQVADRMTSTPNPSTLSY